MSNTQPDAFSFSCSLDIRAIKKEFETVGSFVWRGHDSDTYDIYLSGEPLSPDWPVTLRLFSDGPSYVLEFGYHYSELAKGKKADQAVIFAKDKLLPAIGAADVKEASAFR